LPIDLTPLTVGRPYTRPQLAALWGYQDFHPISRGVFTPRDENLILLFITRKQQPALPQYNNYFDGELLWMDGAVAHGSDDRLSQSRDRDEVYLFYRARSHSPFDYCGPVSLVDSFLAHDQSPSRFIFSARPRLLEEADSLLAADTCSSLELLIGDPEGRKKLRMHVVYERSRKNRERALTIHGRRCVVCNFNFDAVYGPDLAASYIEVHHTRSITEINGETVDPESELFPLCANCHCMAHRRRGGIVPLEELRGRVQQSLGLAPARA
jgi:hypothetical protein